MRFAEVMATVDAERPAPFDIADEPARRVICDLKNCTESAVSDSVLARFIAAIEAALFRTSYPNLRCSICQELLCPDYDERVTGPHLHCRAASSHKGGWYIDASVDDWLAAAVAATRRRLVANLYLIHLAETSRIVATEVFDLSQLRVWNSVVSLSTDCYREIWSEHAGAFYFMSDQVNAQFLAALRPYIEGAREFVVPPDAESPHAGCRDCGGAPVWYEGPRVQYRFSPSEIGIELCWTTKCANRHAQSGEIHRERFRVLSNVKCACRSAASISVNESDLHGTTFEAVLKCPICGENNIVRIAGIDELLPSLLFRYGTSSTNVESFANLSHVATPILRSLRLIQITEDGLQFSLRAPKAFFRATNGV